MHNVTRHFLSKKPGSYFGVRVSAPPAIKTVLVVDDEESVRAFAALVINALGYRALAARDGKDAMAILESQPDHSVDLLLTDLMMPTMSGKELAMRLWEQFPTQRVIFFSGYAEPMARRMWRLDHQVAFLQKPFSSHALAAKIRQAIGDSAAIENE